MDVQERGGDGERPQKRRRELQQRLTLGAGIIRSGNDVTDAVTLRPDWCSRHGIVIVSLVMERWFHPAAVTSTVKKRGVPMRMHAIKKQADSQG